MSQIPQLMSGRELAHDAISERQWLSRSLRNYVTLSSDFIQDASETAVLPFVAAEDGSTGASADFIDAADSVFRLAHDGTSEQQGVGLSLGGASPISCKSSTGASNEVIFEARVKITLATDTFFEVASAYNVIIGLASSGTAISKSTDAFGAAADNVGFRLGGADITNSIFLESDDGTTDNDDKDSGVDFTSGTYAVYKIDMTDLSNVLFFVDGVMVNNGNTFDMSQIAAGDLLEPYIVFARTSASGTERAHTMDIDYIHCTWKRS